MNTSRFITKHNVLRFIHVAVCVCQNFLPFYGSITFHCLDELQCTRMHLLIPVLATVGTVVLIVSAGIRVMMRNIAGTVGPRGGIHPARRGGGKASWSG